MMWLCNATPSIYINSGARALLNGRIPVFQTGLRCKSNALACISGDSAKSTRLFWVIGSLATDQARFTGMLASVMLPKFAIVSIICAGWRTVCHISNRTDEAWCAISVMADAGILWRASRAVTAVGAM